MNQPEFIGAIPGVALQRLASCAIFIAMNPGPKPDREKDMLALNMRLAGKTNREIAKALGLKETDGGTVRRRIKRIATEIGRLSTPKT